MTLVKLSLDELDDQDGVLGGRGRGLGTYGMRLLSERYMGGHVSFTSLPGHGTTFRARYPRG